MKTNFTSFRQLLLLAAVLLSAGTLSAQCDNNLANNPGFENDGDGDMRPDGWYTFGGGTFIMQTTDTPDGTGFAALGVDPNGINNLYVAQGVNGVVAGEDYMFSADIKVDLTNGGYCNIGMNFRGPGGDNSTYFKEPVASTGGTFMNFSITRTAVTTATSNDGTDATSVQIFVEVGGGATVIVDNANLENTTPVAPAMDCAGTLLPNGTFNDNADEYGSGYGNGVGYTADGGLDCGGALQLACTGGGCGVGRYGIAAAPGDQFEVTFQARVANAGNYQNARISFFNSDYSGGSRDVASVDLQGSEFVEYRLVAEAIDASIANVAFETNADDGSTVIFDNVCFVPFTETPVTPVADNFLPNGDFENGNAITGGFNYRLVNDPATGTSAIVSNNAGYSSGTTDQLPVIAGEAYTVSADLKRVGDLQYAKVNITFFDASMTQIGSRLDNNPPATDQYTNFEFDYVAPANAAFIQVQLEASGGNGFFAVDNLAIAGKAILPAELTAFAGEAADKFNVLTWETATEVNVAGFELERSANGATDWNTVLTAAAKGGEGVTASYEVLDQAPLALGYYRLRTVDHDGSEAFSAVISIARENAGIRAFPNPFSGNLTVAASVETASDYFLTDAAGRVVVRGVIAPGTERTTIATEQLPAGQYFLRVGAETIKVVK